MVERERETLFARMNVYSNIIAQSVAKVRSSAHALPGPERLTATP